MSAPSILSRRRFLGSASTFLAAAATHRLLEGSEPKEEALPYFDAFTQIGPRVNKPAEQPWSLAHLQEELRHCSVGGALVLSTMSVSYDPMWSNIELSRQLADIPGLFAIWNVMPSPGGEFPVPTELLRRMREAGVSAVSIHPSSNTWEWSDPASHTLFAALAEARILTIVPVEEIGAHEAVGEIRGLAEVDRLAERYPTLPILLIRANWRHQRPLIPVLKRRRNLLVSFEELQAFHGLEYLVAEGLEDQLVFASNAPTMSVGAHRTYVDYADVPISTRRKIAGGNLRRVLGGQGPKDSQANHNEDALMRAVRHAQPLPAPVIDMHMHVLDEGLHGAGGTYRMWHGDAEGVFRLNRRLGCIGGAVMSWNGTVSADAVGGNATIRRVLDRAPAGYFGAPTFDPVHYSAAEFTRQIESVYSDARLVGMKPYTRYGLPYTDRRYTPWWEYGQARRLYALIHRTRGDFNEVTSLAEKYPDVRWVATHIGMSYPVANQAIEAMQRFPNAFAEITATQVPLGVIEHLVQHAGPDRVLYGSDLAMRDPRQQLGWVVFARLPVETKMKILAGNALNVLAPCFPRLPAGNRPDARLRKS